MYETSEEGVGLASACIFVCASLTWSDDYALGLFNHVDSLIHVNLGVCACDLHGLSCASGRRTVAPQDDVSQWTIHGLTGEKTDLVFALCLIALLQFAYSTSCQTKNI